MHRLRLLPLLLLATFIVLSAPAAAADLLPDPIRPVRDEESTPTPETPPEKKPNRVAVAAVILGLLAAAAAAAAAAAQRRRIKLQSLAAECIDEHHGA